MSLSTLRFNEKLHRLKTFAGKPLLFSAVKLADAGFQFEGNQLLCNLCRFILIPNEYHQYDDFYMIHRNACPSCEFVIAKDQLIADDMGRDTASNNASPQAIETQNNRPSEPSPRQATSLRTTDVDDPSAIMAPEPTQEYVTIPDVLPTRSTSFLPDTFTTTLPNILTPGETPSTSQLGNDQYDPSLPQTARVIPLYEVRQEAKRLETFAAMTSTDRNKLCIPPEQLAAAGLYYIGPGDKVQCAFCHGKLYNWRSSDNPMNEHRKHFSDCKFVKNPYEAGNVPILKDLTTGHPTTASTLVGDVSLLSPDEYMLGLIKERPKYVEYNTTEKRVRTYIEYGYPPTAALPKEELAAAGYFYSGIDDNVRCFFCAGGLRNWREGDDPWEEHARWFKTCAYLRICKGDPYIQIVQDKYRMNIPEVVSQLQQGQLTINSAVAHQPSSSPATNTTSQTALAVEMWLKTPLAERFLDMGYSTQMLRRVYAKRMEDVGDNFPNEASLLDAVLEFESNSHLEHRQDGATSFKGGSAHSTIPVTSPPPPSTMTSGRSTQAATDIFTPKGLMSIAERVGGDWRTIGTYLGFRLAELECFEEDHSRLVDTTFAMLNSWSQRNAMLPLPEKVQKFSRAFSESGRFDIVNLIRQQTDCVTENTSTERKKKKKKKKPKDKRKQQTVEEGASAVCKDEFSSGDEKVGKLERENEDLRDQRLCKICLDQEVNMVFLRCGHLVCCSDCAPAIKTCPICREVIRGTVRIFMA